MTHDPLDSVAVAILWLFGFLMVSTLLSPLTAVIVCGGVGLLVLGIACASAGRADIAHERPRTKRAELDQIRGEGLTEQKTRFTQAADTTTPPVPATPPRTQWAASLAAHDAIADAYGALRCDPIAAIDHLALWDVTNPHTEKFTLAYCAATDLRSLHPTPPTDPAVIDAYAETVRRARSAWDTAVHLAAAHGTNALAEPANQDAARKARGLLAQAADPATTDAERATTTAKAHALIAAIPELRFPHEAAAILAATTRPAVMSPNSAGHQPRTG